MPTNKQKRKERRARANIGAEPPQEQPTLMSDIVLAAGKAAVAEGVDTFVFGSGKIKLDPMRFASDTVCFYTAENFVSPMLGGAMATMAPGMAPGQLDLLADIVSEIALFYAKGQSGILGFKPRPLVEIAARSAAAELAAEALGM